MSGKTEGHRTEGGGATEFCPGREGPERPESTPSAAGYIRPYLDFLKALGITGIFFWHYLGYLQKYYGLEFPSYTLKRAVLALPEEGPLHVAAWGIFKLLFLAFTQEYVSFFFLASGFGLYLSRLDRPRPLPDYAARRALRILPLYWLATIFAWWLFRAQVPPGVLTAHLLLYHPFTPYSHAFGALWFVGYLAQLYVVFPLLARAFERREAAGKLAVIIIALGGYRAALWAGGAVGTDFRVQGLFLRYLAVFVAGMLLAHLYRNRRAVMERIFSPPGSLTALALLAAFSWFFGRTGFQLKLTVETLLLLGALYLPFRGLHALRPVRPVIGFVSRASFLLFLIHMPVYIKVVDLALKKGWISYIVTMQGKIVLDSLADCMLLGGAVYLMLLPVCYGVQRGYDTLAAPLARRLGR